MTLLKPPLHSAHQTLQKQVRSHCTKMAQDWGHLQPLPGSHFPREKRGVTQRWQGKPPSDAFPPVRLGNADTAQPLTPPSYETGAGL